MNRRRFLLLAALLLVPLRLAAAGQAAPCWVVSHPNHATGEIIALVNGRHIAVNTECYDLTASEVQQLHNRGYILFRRFR